MTTAALVLAASMAAMPSSAQPTPVALEVITPNALTLQPQVEWERARLVVGGPDGYRVERWYWAPEPILFSGYNASGNALDDGIYRYELSVFWDKGRIGSQGGYFLAEAGQITPRGPRGEALDPEIERAQPKAGRPTTPRNFSDPGDIEAGGGLSSGDISLDPSDGQLFLQFQGVSALGRYDSGLGISPGVGFPEPPALWVGDSFRVGVNTALPQAELHVVGSGGEVARIDGGVLAVRRTDGGTPNILFTTGPQAWRFLNNGTDGVFSIRDVPALTSPLRIYPGSVASTLVLRNGRLGLGVTNPAYPIHHTTGARLTAGGTWANASSREAKQDIESLTAQEALATLEGLDPVKFAYRVDATDRHLGFIAEDVPELVASPDRKALAAMDVVAVLTKVVQEQERRIAEQQRRDQVQQAEIAELRELVLAQLLN